MFDGVAYGDRMLLRRLRNEGGQREMFVEWQKYSISKRRKIAASLKRLHSTYAAADGLLDYLRRARLLLTASRDGINPLDGWTASIPLPSESVENVFPVRLERAGLVELRSTCFVLVAGGLGERLGYSSIKLALECETTTHSSYLKLYCQYIAAWQASDQSVTIPLVIMTSDDTHARTLALLLEHNNFGLHPTQVTLLRQNKVAALADCQASIALDDQGEPVTKPHGHGDVHSMLFASRFPKRWLAKGKKWVVFFQDTNALAMLALPGCLGVSARDALAVNTLAIERLVGREMGALAKLANERREVITNVEYNQLKPLLQAQNTSEGEVGDVSPYPGNCNCFVVELASYAETIGRTRGEMPEFVNPKYADESRTRFKKATRLECMMQDYPRLLSDYDANRVGFTLVPQWHAYSPVKNSPDAARQLQLKGLPPCCPASGEAEFYQAHAQLLRSIGCRIALPKPLVETAGGVLAAVDGPWIVLEPSFAAARTQLLDKVPNPRAVIISSRSTLVVRGGNVRVESLDLDGALVLDASTPGSSIVVRRLNLRNKGASLHTRHTDAPEDVKVRGYTIMFNQKRTVAPEPNEHVVIDQA